MKTPNLNIRAIKFNGHKIECAFNSKGLPVARLYKFITAGKNKGTWKIEESYYFNTEAKRKTWVEEKISVIKKWDNIKAAEKETKKKAQNELVNPYQVGQLFYNSWGYEQTNIDFYQIVEVKAKSVLLQKIGQTKVEDAGYLCEYVKPNPKIKIGKPSLKQVKVWVTHDGKISSGVTGVSEYAKDEKGIYQSHYA